MKGYVYITGEGADPALNDRFTDPIFGDIPTLGACMPNIRRLVTQGDYIFVVSGRVAGVQQYVVGGMQVQDKIGALAAFKRFPDNRLVVANGGRVVGNVIVDANGDKHPLDHHESDSFESRIENYIIGTNPVVLTSTSEVQRGRDETLFKLSEILDRPRGNRVIDVMSRWAKLSEPQVQNMLDWLHGIKASG